MPDLYFVSFQHRRNPMLRTSYSRKKTGARRKINRGGANGDCGYVKKSDLHGVEQKSRRAGGQNRNTNGAGIFSGPAEEQKSLGVEETESMSDGDAQRVEAIALPPVPVSRLRAPRACKFWRTASGCRAGSDCRFRHDVGAAGGGVSEPEGEAAVAGAKESKPAAGGGRVGEHTGGDGGGGSSGGGDDGVSGVGVDGDAMDVSGVDELAEGMKRLLIPTHLSFGRSARRGKQIGSVGR